MSHRSWGNKTPSQFFAPFEHHPGNKRESSSMDGFLLASSPLLVLHQRNTGKTERAAERSHLTYRKDTGPKRSWGEKPAATGVRNIILTVGKNLCKSVGAAILLVTLPLLGLCARKVPGSVSLC